MNHEPKKSDLVGDLDFFLYYKSDLVGDLEHYINLFSIFWATIIPYHPNRRSKIFFFQRGGEKPPIKDGCQTFWAWKLGSMVYCLPRKMAVGICSGNISWDIMG